VNKYINKNKKQLHKIELAMRISKNITNTVKQEYPEIYAKIKTVASTQLPGPSQRTLLTGLFLTHEPNTKYVDDYACAICKRDICLFHFVYGGFANRRCAMCYKCVEFVMGLACIVPIPTRYRHI